MFGKPKQSTGNGNNLFDPTEERCFPNKPHVQADTLSQFAGCIGVQSTYEPKIGGNVNPIS
jgi:hypothetical protein